MLISNKKIILVGNTAWSMYNFRAGLIKHLIHCGYQVTVIAPHDDVFTDKIIQLGASFKVIKIAAKGTNPIEDLLLIRKFYLIYKELNPNFIFHYTIKPNIYGSIAARLASIPSIAITTGLGYVFDKKNLVSKLVDSLYRFAFLKVKEVWFLNKEDEIAFVKNGIVDCSKTIVLNGEGIDMNHFAPIGKQQNKPSFLLVARMLWEKGVLEFVEAARIIKIKYPDTVFNLLGFVGVDNPSAISLDTIKNWENEGVLNYLGTSSDVRTYLSESTAVVLPSYYREGIPRILLEASAMEKIIITTDNVGCRDVVEDAKTGYLCKVKDVESLVKALETVINLPIEHQIAMGKNGRDKMFKEFDEKLILAEYDKTLNRYLG